MRLGGGGYECGPLGGAFASWYKSLASESPFRGGRGGAFDARDIMGIDSLAGAHGRADVTDRNCQGLEDE